MLFVRYATEKECQECRRNTEQKIPTVYSNGLCKHICKENANILAQGFWEILVHGGRITLGLS